MSNSQFLDNDGARRLRDWCANRGRGSKGELAELLGVSPPIVSDLLAGRVPTLPQAAELNARCRIPFGAWLEVAR